jgi:outer membrane protein OmpA-like peptidoglycan-associated protein
VTGNRFITAMSLAGSGWVGLVCYVDFPTMITAIADPPGEEEDFDALLAASSFGSEQARAIREKTPPAAREHARRVLDGQEKCAPAGADVDDAVGGLVYGLARGVVPGRTVAILTGSALTPDDLRHSSWCRPQADLKLVIFMACQTSMLWPDHRARLLQALIDHDAFADLRHDVAWKIIDWTFDVPRPPRVLLQCAKLAVEQIDFSAIAYTWLGRAQNENAEFSLRHCQSPLRADHVAREEGDPAPTTPTARNSAPPRAALPAAPTKPAIEPAPAETRHSPRRVRAHTRRLPTKPRTGRSRPIRTPGRKHRRTAMRPDNPLALAAAVLMVAIGILLGVLQPGFVGAGFVSVFHGRLAAEPTHWAADSPPASVYFEPNSATLEPGTIVVLQPIAQHVLSQNLDVSITGYASADVAAYEVTLLSMQRADAVRTKLIELGVPPAQIAHVSGADAAALDSDAWCEDGNPAGATCPSQNRAVIILYSATDSP